MRVIGNGTHHRCSDRALAQASWHLWFSLQQNQQSADNAPGSLGVTAFCQIDKVLHVGEFEKMMMMEKKIEVKSMMTQHV